MLVVLTLKNHDVGSEGHPTFSHAALIRFLTVTTVLLAISTGSFREFREFPHDSAARTAGKDVGWQ